MKKYYTLLIAVLLTLSANAQAPEQMSYQAVIRDASNALVTSQAIGMQISILKGSATGASVFTETQTASTNTSGLVSLKIGIGTTSDDFSTINWANDSYFIKIETDPTGGANYTVTGTSQLLSVSYALYAKNSGDKVFSTTNNVTSNVNGDIVNDDFVFGKVQLDDEGSRMFFNKSKAAFRAGSSAGMGLEWSDSNVGSYSFATGINTKANADYSTALGKSTTASGDAATAIGNSTTALGNASTAMGSSTTAESYSQTTLGRHNTVVTGNATTFVPTDRLFVIGNGTNASAKSDALIILKNGAITAPSLDIAEITDNKALVTKEYIDTNVEVSINGLIDGKSDYDGSSIFIGKNAGENDDQTNNGNVGVGYCALRSNTIGMLNTANGRNALYNNTTGIKNTANGKAALFHNVAGSKNVALGYEAGYNETGSNKLYISNSGTATPLIYGEFDTKKLKINGDLKVDEVNATDSGDADMKAYIYGLVRNTGAIDVASSDGFTITKTGTGAYAVNFNNSPGGYNKYIVVASLYGSDGIGFIKMERQSSSITVNTYNTSGMLTDKYFSFIVYKK